MAFIAERKCFGASKWKERHRDDIFAFYTILNTVSSWLRDYYLYVCFELKSQ